MPVHDWTRVNAGTFHDFHSAWIIHIKESLNAGLLPAGYYALSEQHAGHVIADILTLNTGEKEDQGLPTNGNGTVAVAPPRSGRKLVASPNIAYRATRRTLAIRHTSGHRIVALVEIASPANKDRPASVEEFVDKVMSAIHHGIHVLVVDLIPPGPHDPRGMHGAIWEGYDPADYEIPAGQPLSLASYLSYRIPEAIVEHVAVGNPLPEMPLYLTNEYYVNMPLEATYQAAYAGVPAFWRDVIEGRRNGPS